MTRSTPRSKPDRTSQSHPVRFRVHLVPKSSTPSPSAPASPRIRSCRFCPRSSPSSRSAYAEWTAADATGDSAVDRLVSRDNREKSQMSVLGWILLGLIAGFIASKIVNREGQGFLLDIVLGIVGAVVGGFLFRPSARQVSRASISTACSSQLWARPSCFGSTTRLPAVDKATRASHPTQRI